MNAKMKRYTRIDDDAMEKVERLGYAALAVYAHLCFRANPRRGSWCFEPLARIAQALSMRRSTVQAALRKLEDAELIEKRPRHHQTTLYRPRRESESHQLPNPQSTAESNPDFGANDSPAKPSHQLPNRSLTPSKTSIWELQTNNKNISKREDRLTAVPNAQDLVRDFQAQWQEKYRDRYCPDWGKDGMQFKRKLRSIPADEISAKMKVFLHGWWQQDWRSKQGTVRPKIGDFIASLERIPLPAKDEETGNRAIKRSEA